MKEINRIEISSNGIFLGLSSQNKNNCPRILDIININSSIIPPITSKVIALLGFLVHKALTVKIYLVDEKLMDFIYPPEKKRLIDENLLKRYILENDDDHANKENIEDILKKSRDNELKWDSYFIAVGVYVHQDDNDTIRKKIEKMSKKIASDLKFPAIFICPERIRDWCIKDRLNEETLFAKVLYHELGHAYIHNPSKNSEIYKFIEESFCNAVSFSRFKDYDDISDVAFAISKQPLEYRGYTFFIRENYFKMPWWYIEDIIIRRGYKYFFNLDLRLFAHMWKENNSSDMEKYYAHLVYAILKHEIFF